MGGVWYGCTAKGISRQPGRTPIPWPLFMIFGGLSACAAILGYWQYGLSMGPVAMIIVGGWLLVRRT
jgi:hypothetical protein